jgi:hypothetical protein
VVRIVLALMVRPAELSGEVTSFITKEIESLDELELLLLLMQASNRWWDAASVAQTLGMPEEAARRTLDRFASRNLLAIRVTGDVRYQFQPGEPGLQRTMAAFAEACRVNRLAVLQLVTGRPQRSLRAFADAFRIRPDDDR